MTTNIAWGTNALVAIATADDLHIAPRRSNGQTGTPTWIWSVAVDDILYVRAYRGASSSWYRSAIETGTGIIQSGGTTHQVRFTDVDDPQILARVDQAYRRKYDGSAYLPAMLAAGPRAATVAVTPAASGR
jgi:hypothetical protein